MKTLFYLSVLSLLISSCGEGEEETSNEGLLEETSNDTITEIIPEAEIDINLVKQEELPGNLTMEGKVVDIHSWKDINGTNYIIRSFGEMQPGTPQYSDDPAYTQYLYAYHYIEDSNGELTLSREITDFVKDCEFDLILSHELDAITVTDLDADNIGEITFIYRTACTSDVSPSTQKLMLLENGDKYALRGTTQVMGDGGAYEVGEEFNNAPKEFLAHAKKIWSEHLTEYDFEL